MRKRAKRTPAPPSLPALAAKLFYSEQPQELTLSRLRLVKLHSKPNIWRVTNFLTEHELSFLSTFIHSRSNAFESSYTQGHDGDAQIFDEQRTSTFLTCPKGGNARLRSIEERAATLVSFPSTSVEPLQIVSYTQGQKFEAHHDSGVLTGDDSIELSLPVRQVTLFVYLNTLQGQGYTEFPRLGLREEPRRGFALLFPDVRPDGSPEPLTVHAATPVRNARKYGMNVWICATPQRPPEQFGRKVPPPTPESLLLLAPGKHELRCVKCGGEDDVDLVCEACNYGWHSSHFASLKRKRKASLRGWKCSRCAPK